MSRHTYDRIFIIAVIIMALLWAGLILPVDADAQGYIMARPRLVRRISLDGSAANGEAWVSNAGYHSTLMAFPFRAIEQRHGINLAGYDAVLCVRCTGPSNKLPLLVQVRALTLYWGHTTTLPQLAKEGEWYASWTDGYELRLDGPGWECVRIKAEMDYMLQVRNAGLVLTSLYDPYWSAGRTYRLSVSDAFVHLCEGRCK